MDYHANWHWQEEIDVGTVFFSPTPDAVEWLIVAIIPPMVETSNLLTVLAIPFVMDSFLRQEMIEGWKQVARFHFDLSTREFSEKLN